MADNPVNLDEHRGMKAQKATDVRRHLLDVQADQAALRTRQVELEKNLLAMPATNWPEAAAKAEYLIRLFADSVDAQDTLRQKLIASSLEELSSLAESSTDGE